MSESGPPLANLITLGARDVLALRDFYRRMGWRLVLEDDDFAAFELRGIVLAIFAIEKLARDGRTEVEPRQGGIRSTIGVILDRREDVDEMTQKWRESGGRVTKEPVDAEFFKGRSAYVADPEDNFWEFTWVGASNHPVVEAARRAAGLDA
jgi:predicted lactoylglutathione lyase